MRQPTDMKKLPFLIVLFSLLLPFTALADDSDDNDAIWGIKASFDINIPGDWHYDGGSVKMYRHDYGFAAGAVCNLYLGSSFYFEPGASLYYDRYAYSDLSVLSQNDTPTDSDAMVHKFGIRLPAVFGYVFTLLNRLDMTVFTGPEFNCGIIGRITARHKEIFEVLPENIYAKGGQRRFDMAWRFGVGFPMDSFVISVDGAVGMTDLMPGNVSYRDNRASVSVTYYF